METKYLIYSREHNAWWRPNSRGYTSRESDAGRYGYDEANRTCVGAGLDDRDAVNEFMYLAPECITAAREESKIELPA
jgi:hypothetical protein